MIYTDQCYNGSIAKIKAELGMDVTLSIDPKTWTLSDAMGIITLPSIELAIINSINEITVLEMALLHFMCKPILVTSKNIINYPILKDKIIDYVCLECNLTDENNTFIEWYKKWQR